MKVVVTRGHLAHECASDLALLVGVGMVLSEEGWPRPGSPMISSRGGVRRGGHVVDQVPAGVAVGRYSRHPLALWRSCATGREVHSGS